MQHQDLEYKVLKQPRERLVHFNDNTYNSPSQALYNFKDQSLLQPSLTNNNNNNNVRTIQEKHIPLTSSSFTDRDLKKTKHLPSTSTAVYINQNNNDNNKNNNAYKMKLKQTNNNNNKNYTLVQNLHEQFNPLSIYNTDDDDDDDNNNNKMKMKNKRKDNKGDNDDDDLYYDDVNDDYSKDDDDGDVYDDNNEEYDDGGDGDGDGDGQRDNILRKRKLRNRRYNINTNEIKEYETTLAKIIYHSKNKNKGKGDTNNNNNNNNLYESSYSGKYHHHYPEKRNLKGFKAYTSKPEVDFLEDVTKYTSKRSRKLKLATKMIEKESGPLNDQIHLLMEQLGGLKAKIQFIESKNKKLINNMKDDTGYYKNLYAKKFNRIRKNYPFRKNSLD